MNGSLRLHQDGESVVDPSCFAPHLALGEGSARAVYNTCQLLFLGLKSGQDYGELKPTYAIWLLAENLITDDNEYVHHYKVRDEQGRTFT